MIPSSFGALNSRRTTLRSPASSSSNTARHDLSMKRDYSVTRLVGLNPCLKYDGVWSGGWDAGVDDGSGYRGVFRRVAGAFRTMAASLVDKRS
jgi:hypothetical protein